MTDVFSDGLGVGYGKETVLLVRALEDLGCRLASSETGQMTLVMGFIAQNYSLKDIKGVSILLA